MRPIPICSIATVIGEGRPAITWCKAAFLERLSKVSLASIYNNRCVHENSLTHAWVLHTITRQIIIIIIIHVISLLVDLATDGIKTTNETRSRIYGHVAYSIYGYANAHKHTGSMGNRDTQSSMGNRARERDGVSVVYRC